LYLGYHWLTDVVASMGLALAVTGMVILADGLRAARAGRTAPVAPPVLAAKVPSAEVPSAEVPSAEVPSAEVTSERDAHRLGDHHSRS